MYYHRNDNSCRVHVYGRRNKQIFENTYKIVHLWSDGYDSYQNIYMQKLSIHHEHILQSEDLCVYLFRLPKVDTFRTCNYKYILNRSEEWRTQEESYEVITPQNMFIMV